ncbi:hypothetical protein [uncultured Tessaracoccus sp.]|uniref:hypothetical protein n=1 Tax=uncultured Tessaracoccus sp. TaxID=905023 RepID=UPI00262D1653|nr:hypothetical protein [uncultured Tessaracoccus sp.]
MTLKRRTLVAGTAWAAPAVVAASAVPAFAASQTDCETVVSVWQPTEMNLTGGPTYTLTKTSNCRTWDDNNVHSHWWRRMPKDYDLTPTDKATISSSWLNIAQAVQIDDKKGEGQTITVRFPQPVYGITFYIGQIDSSSDAPSWYRDQLIVSVSGPNGKLPITTRHDYTDGAALPSTVVVEGDGSTEVTATSPNRVSQFPITGRDHRGTVRYDTAKDQPVTEISIFYGDAKYGANAVLGNGGMGRQFISVSPIRWSTC